MHLRTANDIVLVRLANLAHPENIDMFGEDLLFSEDEFEVGVGAVFF